MSAGISDSELFHQLHFETLRISSLDEPVMIAPDLTNLPNLVQEVKRTASQNPVDHVRIPETVRELFRKLWQANDQLSSDHQMKFALPLITHLERKVERSRGDLVLDPVEREAIRTVLLNGNVCPRIPGALPGSFCQATMAGQELVTDLYSNFVDTSESPSPPHRRTPTLHNWHPTDGPHTYHIAHMENLGLRSTLVSMPVINSLGGLLAWTTYAHEVAGHNNLHAKNCLNGELQNVFRSSLRWNYSVDSSLVEYWSSRVDETVSDVLGLLSLGPAAGIGLVGYFRGLSENNRLRANGLANDPHPSDLVRGLLAAKVIRKLNFVNAGEWETALENEVLKDYPLTQRYNAQGRSVRFPASIQLGSQHYSYDQVVHSVDAVATIALDTPLGCMGNQALSQLRAWNDNDMERTAKLMEYMQGRNIQPLLFRASHVVSAATLAALKRDANIQRIFKRMIDLLSQLHLDNSVGVSV